MSELMEVFEMVTKQTEPDLDAWKHQEDRQRRSRRSRRLGAYAAVAAIAAAIVLLFVATRPAEDTSSPTPGDKGSDNSGPAVNSGLSRHDHIVVGLDGRNAQAVTGLPEDAFALSPSGDGRVIAFVTKSDGENHIASIGIDGQEMQVLGSGIEPAMSPDGTRIAFVRDNDIYVMNADGSAEQRIVGNPHVDEFPQWSPDGTTIVFDHYASEAPTDSGYANSSSIMVVPANGGGATRIAQSGETDGEPTYSPDGTQIAYRRLLGIWVMDADGSNPHPVAPDVGVVDGPRWSPDGTKIAFSRYNDGGWRAYLQLGDLRRDFAVGDVQYVDVRTGEISSVGDLSIATFRNAPNWLPSGELLLSAVYAD